jgi:hypothetical protein
MAGSAVRMMADRVRHRTSVLVSQKSELKAKVMFVGPSQGGPRTPARSGTRSQLKVDDLSTSSVVRGDTEAQVFEFDVEYDVTLELMFWDRYKDSIYVGMPVELCEGSRTVGLGRIEAIVTA